MKRIRVEYFAILKEQRGVPSETVETAARTSDELYEELKAQHDFTLPASLVQVAINGAFAGNDRQLNDGDELVFIPPVAGG